MELHPVDWLLIGGYCVGALLLGAYFSKRASKNIDEFFVADAAAPLKFEEAPADKYYT